MGNTQQAQGVHDSFQLMTDKTREINLARSLNYRQYCRHVEGKQEDSCLTEIPANLLSTLSLTERMNISFNMIPELPSTLPLCCPHLVYLDISHNQLQNLPDDIGHILHLETLLVKYNQLRRLPYSLFHLTRLLKLDLSHNSLKTISSEVIHLESLEKLNVSKNRLTALPSSLGGVKTLKVLLASENRFCEPLQKICEYGSDELLAHLRKNFNLSGQCQMSGSAGGNMFPRVRGNHLHSSVPNPQSAQVQYIQAQTHTANTSSRIKSPLLPPRGASDLEAFMLRDRILGLLFGAAIGDAMGLATCCMTSDECRFHYGGENITYDEILQDELRVRWKQGDWTSNFDMMVLLLESVLGWAGVLDELEFARRLRAWCLHGHPELGDKAGLVLSETVKQVVEHPEFLKNPHIAATSIMTKSNIHVYAVEHNSLGNENGDDDDENPSECSEDSDSESYCENQTTGPLFPSSHPCIPSKLFGTDNGELVQIAILGVPYFHDVEEVEANTARICKTTHGRPVCVAASVLVTNLVAQMLQGRSDLTCHKSVEEMVSRAVTIATKHIPDSCQQEEFNRYVNHTSLSSVNFREQFNMSYSLKAMSAGLIALKSQQSFKSFMMSLFMEGGDSNSNGCVAGALLGCRLGYSRLPPDWLKGLRKPETDWLNVKINHFLDMIGLP
ncbi:uncharacterized protein LOC128217103 [Mya arenaria]|uniref:uncharacterized protein LOC128217103 n=1 Tax=Mya arenaria TaxID=6604 RepID=UPI0022E486CA|nr:uncharacterized protein LOC128217103 [Mya arenaria]XP_052779944.1 uncharacterized protein LOC128217103 [Mya arenaria]